MTATLVSRWCLGAAAVLAVASTATPSAAQTPYRVTHSTDTYTRFPGGTSHVPVAYGPFTNWDEGSAAISLPFSFDWYGVDYTTVYVYTNGFISFSPPPSGALSLLTPPRNVPSTTNQIHNFIGVVWTDLIAGTNPSIRSRVSGLAGSRVVAIQVEGLVAGNNPNSGVSFQVFLSESNNQVDIVYGPNFGLSSITAGIENSTGTDGQNLMASSPSCGMTCTCTPRFCTSSNFPPNKRITVRPPDTAELNAGVDAPNGALPGASFQLEVVPRNVGLTAAGAFRYEVRLATSATSTAGSTLLRTVDVPSLAALTSRTDALTLTVPPATPVGTFYIAVVVDSTRVNPGGRRVEQRDVRRALRDRARPAGRVDRARGNRAFRDASRAGRPAVGGSSGVRGGRDVVLSVHDAVSRTDEHSVGHADVYVARWLCTVAVGPLHRARDDAASARRRTTSSRKSTSRTLSTKRTKRTTSPSRSAPS